MYQDSKGLAYIKTTVAVKTLKGILLKSCVRAFTVDFTILGDGRGSPVSLEISSGEG